MELVEGDVCRAQKDAQDLREAQVSGGQLGVELVRGTRAAPPRPRPRSLQRLYAPTPNTAPLTRLRARSLCCLAPRPVLTTAPHRAYAQYSASRARSLCCLAPRPVLCTPRSCHGNALDPLPGCNLRDRVESCHPPWSHANALSCSLLCARTLLRRPTLGMLSALPSPLRLATACMQVLTTAPMCSPRPCPRCRWLELLAERDRMKRFFRRLMNMELARSFSSWLSHLDDLAEQARLIGSDCV